MPLHAGTICSVDTRGSRELERGQLPAAEQGTKPAAGCPRRPLRQIVALGGGGFSMEPDNPLMDDYLMTLARERSEWPRVCFLPTASGDADHYIVRFYRHFGARCEASHVSLFRRDKGAPDPIAHLLDQDLIYVGGGSVLSMLGAWRAHGLDEVLADAWQRGVILAGLSAGSLCWFREGVTAFHGEAKRIEGLGFLPCSNTVHYDDEKGRDVAYRKLLLEGMPSGYAVEDGAALHFVGARLARVVASRQEAKAYRMRNAGGRIVRCALPSRYLGDVAPTAAQTPLAAVA
jgi:dipeptidase E